VVETLVVEGAVETLTHADVETFESLRTIIIG